MFWETVSRAEISPTGITNTNPHIQQPDSTHNLNVLTRGTHAAPDARRRFNLGKEHGHIETH